MEVITPDELLVSAAHVAELFRIHAVDHADSEGFLPLYYFRKCVADKALAALKDFPEFVFLLRRAALEGTIPFEVEFKGPQTPVEVATAARLTDPIRFWDGKRQNTVMHIKITDARQDTLYDPYVNVTWANVVKGDYVFIDNYQRGKFPKASPQISGPYEVKSVPNRELVQTWYPYRQFMYYPDNLLREK